MKSAIKFIWAMMLLFATPCINAQLIAYENFNYSPGSIVGQNGGSGWSGAWLTTTFNSSNTMIAAPGLTMPPEIAGIGNQNHQVGNDFRNFRYLDTTSALALSLMDNMGDPGATGSQNYYWGQAYGKDGTTFWFSFLFYRSNSNQGYGGMHLMYGMNLSYDQYGDKKSHQRFQFGADNSHLNYMMSRTINGNVNLPGCSQTVQGSTAVNGTLHLLVHRIDFKAGAETAYMWIDPLSCQQPDTALADVKMYSICDFRFNAINLGAGNNANYEMDEFRMGLTYNDVVGCNAGINNAENNFQFCKLFPNPGNGHFDLTFYGDHADEATMIISNSLGEMVANKTIQSSPGVNNLHFEMNDLPAGMYSVHIIQEGKTISTHKLMVAP